MDNWWSSIAFNYDNSDGTIKCHVHSGDATWTELFDEFRHFLNGIGYFVPPGEWVEEEDA